MSVFKGSIEKNHLNSIIDAATVLVEECRVFFKKDGITVRGTDPAGVGLVVIEIDEAAFDDVTNNGGDVCWDFSEMGEMIDTVGSNEDVTLDIDLSGVDIDILDLDYNLRLIDPEALEKDQEKPDLDLPAEVVFGSSVFKRGVKASDLVANHVEFGIDEDSSAFYMEAKGDTNKVILERKKRDLVTLSTDSVSSTYSIKYLKELSTAIPDDTELKINFGDAFPTEISFDLVDENATVTYFIAPRLKGDS